jgi:hypothetical protein
MKEPMPKIKIQELLATLATLVHAAMAFWRAIPLPEPWPAVLWYQ